MSQSAARSGRPGSDDDRQQQTAVPVNNPNEDRSEDGSRGGGGGGDRERQQSQQQNNTNNRAGNASPSPNGNTNDNVEEERPQLPSCVPILLNMVTFSLGVIVFTIMMEGEAREYIKLAGNPTVTLSNKSVEPFAIQTITPGTYYLYILFFVMSLAQSGLNLFELFAEKVFAKHRKNQLILNRIASGMSIAVVISATVSLFEYVQRRNYLVSEGALDAYDLVLAFWILLVFLCVFVIWIHVCAPNENRRRHDLDMKYLQERRRRSCYHYRDEDCDDEEGPLNRAPDRYE